MRVGAQAPDPAAEHNDWVLVSVDVPYVPGVSRAPGTSAFEGEEEVTDRVVIRFIVDQFGEWAWALRDGKVVDPGGPVDKVWAGLRRAACDPAYTVVIEVRHQKPDEEDPQ